MLHLGFQEVIINQELRAPQAGRAHALFGKSRFPHQISQTWFTGSSPAQAGQVSTSFDMPVLVREKGHVPPGWLKQSLIRLETANHSSSLSEMGSGIRTIETPGSTWGIQQRHTQTFGGMLVTVNTDAVLHGPAPSPGSRVLSFPGWAEDGIWILSVRHHHHGLKMSGLHERVPQTGANGSSREWDEGGREMAKGIATLFTSGLLTSFSQWILIDFRMEKARDFIRNTKETGVLFHLLFSKYLK